MDPQVIRDQMEAAMSSQDLDTVKIGMLGHPDTIDAVAGGLKSQNWKNVVLDPVLICKGQEPGAALDTDNALREKILPLATVATPNYFEACTLAGMDKLETVQDLAELLSASPSSDRVTSWSRAALISQVRKLSTCCGMARMPPHSPPQRLVSTASRAPATLAAAITPELAKGTDIHDAVRIAKYVVTDGIRARVSGHTPFDTVWQGAYVPPLPAPEKKGAVISIAASAPAASAAGSEAARDAAESKESGLWLRQRRLLQLKRRQTAAPTRTNSSCSN